jgi:flavin reductase (DIM6/NTAB) family NADH-FMN oxidoreductase RutF
VSPGVSVSLAEFRAIMGSFAAGVTVITTLDARGEPHALTATAFSSLSATPPHCLVCVDLTARAHAPLLETRRFAVNLLAAHQTALSLHFASKDERKFDGQVWTPGAATGCPLLPEVIGWLECELTAHHAGGDHDIFVGHVLRAGVSEGEPLVYHRGHYARIVPVP